MHCVYPLLFFRTGSEALIGLVQVMAPTEVLGIDTTGNMVQVLNCNDGPVNMYILIKEIIGSISNEWLIILAVAIIFSLRLSRPKLKYSIQKCHK
jgi:hypothetical protein